VTRWRPRLGIWRHLLLAAAVGIALAMSILFYGFHRALRRELAGYAEANDAQLAERQLNELNQAYLNGGAVLLQQAAQELASESDSRIQVLDASGTVVVDTSPGANAACKGLGFEFDHLGTAPGSPLPPLHGELCLPYRSTVPAGQVVALARELVLPALGGFLGALALSLLLSRRIALPLHRLAAAARRFGGGDLSARVPVAGAGEIADLASEFNRMAEGLEQAQQQRQALVADVAHELRTPLTVLRGYLEALKDGVTPVDAETLAVIHGEAVQLGHLVDDLQDLAQADAAQLTLDARPCDLGELLRAVAAGFALQAAAKGVGVEVEAPDALPEVSADRRRVAQVIHNLLANALRYTPAGGHVRLSAVAVAAGVEVDVADTGIGIAAEHLPRVFERFYRVDPSRARDTGGTGLGLTIAKRIIDAHGGQIGVASTPGAGSRFWFILPRTA